METQIILESCKKILCNTKLYKDIDFFKINFNKVSLAVIKEITKKSYADIGKEFKKSWFSIYSSVKDTKKNGLKHFTDNVIELVKKDLK